jgi:predicted SprT family Zn-dependent metalloprotease
MTTARKPTHLTHAKVPSPPPVEMESVIHGDREMLQHWLQHYWQKLLLPDTELHLLAITQDRQEFMQWIGKRLNTMALGCYCYIPAPSALARQRKVSGATERPAHRHLIFIEPDMQPKSIEVTVAHELIHLADRVHGTPRRHHHHGYDSIAADEAAITGYGLEELRSLLHEESTRREHVRRERRPIRYLYECPNCGKTYPRTRKYSQAVSCSSCDKSFNPKFRLLLSVSALNM